MSEPVQNYENHAKFVPVYHFVAFPLIVVNAGWRIYRAVIDPSADAVIAALTAVALIIVFFFARIFALRVQDRVIRLEMRMRLRDVLPLGLHVRINEFTTDQLVALRFASDAELSELAQMVLRDRIQDKKAIKRMIRDWQADHCRA